LDAAKVVKKTVGRNKSCTFAVERRKFKHRSITKKTDAPMVYNSGLLQQ